MSTTSGPVVTESTGKSSDRPSGRCSVAVLLAMAIPLRRAHARDHLPQVGRIVIASPGDDVPQIVVGQIKKLGELGIVGMPGEITLKHDVELEQPAAAFPLELFALHTV